MSAPIPLDMFCEISFLKDSVDLIGKNHALISYFGYRSTPAVCTVAIWKNPLLTSGSITSVCPKTVYPLALLFIFQKRCDFYLGFLEILPNNHNKQWYISLHGESEQYVDNALPVLPYNLFLSCQFLFFHKELFNSASILCVHDYKA